MGRAGLAAGLGQGSNFDVAPDAAVATGGCGCYLF